jgi:hypothetical protein
MLTVEALRHRLGEAFESFQNNLIRHAFI